MFLTLNISTDRPTGIAITAAPENRLNSKINYEFLLSQAA
jgi:hypothetical protein